MVGSHEKYESNATNEKHLYNNQTLYFGALVLICQSKIPDEWMHEGCKRLFSLIVGIPKKNCSRATCRFLHLSRDERAYEAGEAEPHLSS